MWGKDRDPLSHECENGGRYVAAVLVVVITTLREERGFFVAVIIDTVGVGRESLDG